MEEDWILSMSKYRKGLSILVDREGRQTAKLLEAFELLRSDYPTLLYWALE